MAQTDTRALALLARLFPTQASAAAELMNLSAILNLPKGTEFFCSDIHGEYEAFSHTIRNGSGSIRLKIEDVFGDQLSEQEKRALTTRARRRASPLPKPMTSWPGTKPLSPAWWRWRSGRRRNTRAPMCAVPCRQTSPTPWKS